MADPRLLLAILASIPTTTALSPSCSGHGAFSLFKGKIGCFCEPGWSGWDCGTPVCEQGCIHGKCTAPDVCVCAAGYFGRSCAAKTCPNDCSGHGTCLNGTCSCDLLFTGTDCSLPKCVNDCSGHGSCKADNTCACDAGFTSVDCSLRTCPADCSAHGDCNTTDGTCACWAGYAGKACSDLSCEYDCGDHGTCLSGKCVCTLGFTGEACNVPEPIPCSDIECGWPRGRCKQEQPMGVPGLHAAVPTPQCECLEGWNGVDCADKACPEDCSGHGRCSPSSGVCVCGGGWWGPACSEPPCPTGLGHTGLAHTGGVGEIVPCSGKGLCHKTQYGGVCKCYDGYDGDACEKSIGCPGGCGPHGTCEQGQCVCEEGFTGTKCETRGCGIGGCGGHGRCEDGVCMCFTGWEGKKCEAKACPNGCSTPNGVCLSGGVCACSNGYHGDDCSKHRGCPDDCYSKLGRGVCVGSPGLCSCAPGFVGDNCGEASPSMVVAAAKLHLPLPTVCNGKDGCGPHGTCNGHECVCAPGWRGVACDLLSCSPAAANQTSGGACGPHGVCIDGACQCDAGFVTTARGLYCQKQCPLDCHSPNGMCVDGVCQCSEGFAGDDCSGVVCPNGCSGRGICQAPQGKCQCYPGFGGIDCSVLLCASNCSGHGKCTGPMETIYNQVTHAVSHARKYGRGETAPTATAAPDRNGLTAPPKRFSSLDAPTHAVCVCAPGWAGNKCEMPACPEKCSNRGTCLPDGRCECHEGWKGFDCTTRACPSDLSGNECGGITHGTCGYSGRCQCKSGWSGNSCERPACPIGSSPKATCSARGSCIVDTHYDSAKCVCEAPFTGPACEAAYCPNSCTGPSNGVCLQPPDPRAGECECKQGYHGADCSKKTCPSDCNGRGDCDADGMCICAAGWAGVACELVECAADAPAHLPTTKRALKAVAASAPLTALLAGGGKAQGCGPHGTCDPSKRVCVCSDGWTGADCSYKPCPHNCHSRGVCGAVTPGVCQCDPHYTGDSCESIVSCASGCNNHGVCDPKSGRCRCNDGWSGADCEHKACPHGPNGEAPCGGRGRCINGECECEVSGANATAACKAVGRCMHNCNGKGVCTNDKCTCEAGWSGLWCQHKQCNEDCGEHGVCVHGGCSCDAGWEGATCELQQCVGIGRIGCGEHGVCEQPTVEGGLAMCQCHRGWVGADCSVPNPVQTAEMYEPAPPPSPPPWFEKEANPRG